MPSLNCIPQVTARQGHGDFELIRAFVETGDEQAFTDLVHRHVNLVFASAMRQVRDHHLAEEITQAVFVLLAQKAPTFSEDIIVSGWLIRASRFAAANVLRANFRRKQRDFEALQATSEPDAEQSWEVIAPFLDEAIANLAAADRHAVTLRFLEQKDLHEVGIILGTNQEAAKKRVARAVGKLQRWLKRRGVAVSALTLGALLTEKTLEAAPASTVSSTLAAALSHVPLSETGTAILNAASRGLSPHKFVSIFGPGILFIGLLSATLTWLAYFGLGEGENLRNVMRQSQKALADGEGAKFVEFMVFTEDGSQQVRQAIDECVRSEYRLKKILIDHFGRSTLAQLRWPFPIDEISEAEIFAATELFRGKNASLKWRRGSALAFTKSGGVWKFNLYSNPGETVAGTISGYDRKRRTMDLVAEGVQRGTYSSAIQALGAYVGALGKD